MKALPMRPALAYSDSQGRQRKPPSGTKKQQQQLALRHDHQRLLILQANRSAAHRAAGNRIKEGTS
jgi:hypothetical protein